MKVFLYSSSAEKAASYIVHASPAGDTDWDGYSPDFPAAWTNRDGAPVRFEVDFKFGAAEVPDELGKYMVARGIAHSSRAARKIRQLFDRAGNAITELFDSEGRRVDVRADM
jgi:hypothetical protein